MTTEITLIGTDTAPISRWWVKQGLRLIGEDGAVFGDMREARVKFIAGSNRIRKTIKNWLLAADLVTQEGRSLILKDNGRKILANDPELMKSSTWLAIHLGICFSGRGEPYISLFQTLDPSFSDWTEWKVVLRQVYEHKLSGRYEFSSVKSDLEAVRGMFESGGPLNDLELLELRKSGDSTWLRTGSQRMPDQAILHALALARHRHFPTRSTIHFSELDAIRFHHFLCLPLSALRSRLRELSRAAKWQRHFEFLEGQNLDSVRFGDQLNPNQTILSLLQETEDTWI